MAIVLAESALESADALRRLYVERRDAVAALRVRTAKLRRDFYAAQSPAVRDQKARWWTAAARALRDAERAERNAWLAWGIAFDKLPILQQSEPVLAMHPHGSYHPVVGSDGRS